MTRVRCSHCDIHTLLLNIIHCKRCDLACCDRCYGFFHHDHDDGAGLLAQLAGPTVPRF